VAALIQKTSTRPAQRAPLLLLLLLLLHLAILPNQAF
jgi:hypothetical protein